MLAKIRVDTWNALNMHPINPNSNKMKYSDIPGVVHLKKRATGNHNSHVRKLIWRCRQKKWQPFCHGKVLMLQMEKTIRRRTAQRIAALKPCCIPVKFLWIFPGAPLIFNRAPGNIQGNLTGMLLSVICSWARSRGGISMKSIHPSDNIIWNTHIWS